MVLPWEWVTDTVWEAREGHQVVMGWDMVGEVQWEEDGMEAEEGGPEIGETLGGNLKLDQAGPGLETGSARNART